MNTNEFQLAYGYFPTGKKLATFLKHRIQRSYSIQPGMQGLEPSAGDGVLANIMTELGLVVDVCETDRRLQQRLYQAGYQIIGNDFLKLPVRPIYDVILMNPPFSSPKLKGVDGYHVRRAYQWLKLGGFLTAIISESFEFRDLKARQFRQFLRLANAKVYSLPLEAFWDSDRPITVATYLVEIRKISYANISALPLLGGLELRE